MLDAILVAVVENIYTVVQPLNGDRDRDRDRDRGRDNPHNENIFVKPFDNQILKGL